MAQRGNIDEAGRESAQRKHFPDRSLEELIEITDGLRNRPTFSEARAHLKTLFIDLLRYERDGADITRRADLAPSAYSPQVLSLARLEGLQVCLVERQGAGFYPENYRKIFRLHQECILFVHSSVDRRIRIALRPRKGRRTYRYRSLVPRCVLGPRSDRTASWAMRLGLLSPKLDEPGHVNYEAVEDVLFDPLTELLDIHDPYRWNNRQRWMGGLGMVEWTDHLSGVVDRFFQTGTTRHERRVHGLHEALLRSFPMYVEGEFNQRLVYDGYSLEESAEGELQSVKIRIKLVEEHEDDRCTHRYWWSWKPPELTEAGLLRRQGREWQFQGRAGFSMEWSDNIPEEDSSESIEATEDQLDKLVDPKLDEELAALEEDIEDEGGDNDFEDRPLVDDAVSPEAEEVVPFLSLQRALGYEVSRQLRKLRWYIRNYSREEDATLREHVMAMLKQWTASFDRGEAESMLSEQFVEDYFREVTDQGLEASYFGKTVEAHSVEFEEDESPQWSCPVVHDVTDRHVPVDGSVAHPVDRMFIVESGGAELSSYARLLEVDVGCGSLVSAMLAAFKANRRPVDRIAVVPDSTPHPAMTVCRDSPVYHRLVRQRLVLHRRLGTAEVLTTAPRTCELRSRDNAESGPWQVVADERLDDETGFVQEGIYVQPGDPLAARGQPVDGFRPTSEERFYSRVLTDEVDGLAHPRRDRSWYVPSGVEGVVRRIEFDGDGATGGGPLRVVIDRLRRLETGSIVATSNGLTATVQMVRPREVMPFTVDGDAVDAVMTVPEKQYKRWNEAHDSTPVFDADGSLLEEAVLLEGTEAAVVESPQVWSQGRTVRRNVWGQPMVEEHRSCDDLLPILAQLDAIGAPEAMRRLVGELHGMETQEADPFRARWKLRELLGTLGLKAEFRGNSMELSIHGGTGESSESLENPTETLNYRTGMPKPGGLCDPFSFEPVPRRREELGGVQWDVLDSKQWQQRWHHLREVDNSRCIEWKGTGPVRLASLRKIPGNACIKLPEPMLHPFAERLLAEHLGVSTAELSGVLQGWAHLRWNEEHCEWFVEDNSDVWSVIEAEPETTGIAAIQRVLDRLDDRQFAERMHQAIWVGVPVLNMSWRPMVESPDGETQWSSSELNALYVRLAQAVDRMRRIRKRSRVFPLVILNTLRGQLHDCVRTLFGLREEENDGWEWGERRQLQYSDGLIGSLRRFIRRRLAVGGRMSLPQVVRGSWVISEPVRRVGLPADHLLDCWRKKVARWMVEDGACERYADAIRAVESSAPDARRVLRIRVNTGVHGGYLVTAQSLVEPVLISVVESDSPIEVPEDIARKTGVEPRSELAVYVPSGEEAQEEVLEAVGRRRLVPRFGTSSTIVQELLTRWGHVWTGPAGAGGLTGSELGSSPDDGGALPKKRNVATWLLRQMTRWPVDIQESFLEQLFDGEFESTKAIDEFVGKFEESPARQLVDVAVKCHRIQDSRQRPKMLWQLVETEYLEEAISSDIQFRSDDFLSRLVLGRLAEDSRMPELQWTPVESEVGNRDTDADSEPSGEQRSQSEEEPKTPGDTDQYEEEVSNDDVDGKDAKSASNLGPASHHDEVVVGTFYDALSRLGDALAGESKRPVQREESENLNNEEDWP